MRRLGAVLTWVGVGIWGLGIVAWMQSAWVTLPPDKVKVLVLTLAALMGGVLVAAGAATSRAGHIMSKREIESTNSDSQSALPTPAPAAVNQKVRAKDPA